MLGLTPSEEMIALEEFQRAAVSDVSVSKPKKEKPEVEEEKVLFNREEFQETYRNLIIESYVLKKKNSFLQKKLYDFCKLRKMTVYFQELDAPSAEMNRKYEKELKVYEDYRAFEEKVKHVINQEMAALREEKRRKEELLAKTLNSYLELEKQHGLHLVFKNGKHIPEKTLERLLLRQRSKISEVAAVRLIFIKVRDRVLGKEEILKQKETLGEGLHLLDYEQLRMENQSYGDKIEEREEELARLRNRATSAIQVLAHVREKLFSTTQNIEETYEALDYSEVETASARQYLNSLKRRLDELRAEEVRLRQESGLLVLPRLLKDFEQSIVAHQQLAAEIQNLKNSYHDKQRVLTSMRNTVSRATRVAQSVSTANEHRRNMMAYQDLLEGKIRTMSRYDETKARRYGREIGRTFSDVQEDNMTRPYFLPPFPNLRSAET